MSEGTTKIMKRILSGMVIVIFLAICFGLFALIRFYPDQSRKSVIEIYRALSPGMSREAVRRAYRDKKSLFMKLREDNSNSWRVFDAPACTVSDNWGLWLDFTNNILAVVHMHSYSSDNKPPTSLYPDKVLEQKGSGSVSRQTPND